MKLMSFSYLLTRKHINLSSRFHLIQYLLQLAHLTVLTGYRMLPRKDLVRAKQYFIIDAACAAIAYAIHQADYFYFILILQQWQHIFYYSTWDKSAAAKV